MRCLWLNCIVAFIAWVCGASCLFGDKSLFYRESNNNYFLIVAEDYDSGQTMAHLSEVMGDLGETYVPLPNDLEPIRVELIPASQVEFEIPYVIRPQPNGGVTLLMRWGDSLSFAETCQALASVYLTRAAVYYDGPQAVSAVPDWLELAFAVKLVMKVKPAMVAEFRKPLLKRGPLELDRIFAAKAPFGGEQYRFSINAYWFLEYFEKVVGDADLKRRAMQNWLVGEPPQKVLEYTMPNRGWDPLNAELWWQVGAQDIVQSRRQPFYSMEDSRELVRKKAFIVYENSDEVQRLSSEVLWDFREREGLDVLVRDRIRELKLEIQRINPVYHNALLDLGFALRALNSGEKENYQEAHKTFLSSFLEAQELELEIRHLLRQL